MNLLLDTQALLWWLADAEDLKPGAREAIGDPERLVYVSAVSVWEIVIKRALGKLEFPDDLPTVLEAEPFQHLDMTNAHAFKVSELRCTIGILSTDCSSHSVGFGH